jgi:glycine oxidase
VKSWDVVIIGGGIIGLSLARELRKHDSSVLVVERGEPGREASHAAAGMLAYCDPHLPPKLRALADASAQLYPEFVHELEDESGDKIDLRWEGAIILDCDEPSICKNTVSLNAARLAELEPSIPQTHHRAELWPEGSVDPRALTSAALKAAKHRGVEIAVGTPVVEIRVAGGRATGVMTSKTHFPAATVINCAGAWAGDVSRRALAIPTRPVKGQMLSLVAPRREILRHVVRSPEVYLVPRSDGRILVGTTLEEAGFNKRTDADTIQRLHQSAANLIPALGEARMLEAWAGLRPGTPDNLPILGATSLPGYFVATGHFRDGILLSAVTAKVIAEVVRGANPQFDLTAFSPGRFAGL